MSDAGRRTDEIFLTAVDLEGAARDRYLDDACAGDDELRARVEAMLRAEDALPTAFLGGGEPDASVGAPERIGPYRILRELGRGGMGVVYEAEQESPSRRVALKVVRQGFARAEHVARFKREVHALAQLQHRGIAHIYESGSTQIGEGEWPYFAMEFIDGLPLDRHADEHDLSTRDRLELIARVCDAVQHAHQRGVIHRDLKPANVLVLEESAGSRSAHDSATHVDAIGQPKILDFGIARFTDADVQATMRTSTGQIIGTLAYMSPEQVEGRPEALDTRVDVYALGVMLYTLVAGQPPHELGDMPVHEAARVIKEDEPTLLGSIDTALRGDIATIAQKAMAKERDRRYASAAELADDIRRHLRHEPISAAPPSTLYQLSKFTKRNKALVGGVAASFLILVLGVIGTAIGLAWALRTKDDLQEVNGVLEQANRNLEKVAAFQENQLAGVDPSQMGVQQRAWLLGAIEEEGRETLDAAFRAINFTDAARATLDENILAPSIEAIDTEFQDQLIIQGRLLRAVARTRRQLGLYDAAEAPAQRAFELHDTRTGPHTEEAARTANELGQLRLAQGRYEDAERLYRRGLDLIKTTHSEKDPQVLAARHDIATAIRAQGNSEEAERLVRAVIEDLERQVKRDDQRLLSAKNTLGALLGDLGQHNEAAAVRREVVDARRESLGLHDPRTLSAIHNLASDLSETGAFEEAEALFREEIEACYRVHGEHHPRTVIAMTELAWMLQYSSRLAESETLYRDALRRYRDLLGNNHPSTVATMNNLASTLDIQSKYEEAEPLYREALEINRRVLGEDHPRTITGLGNLGYVLNRLGRPEETEPLYRESLAAFRRTLGNEHPSTLNALGNLGSLLLKLSKDDEAETLLIESYESRLRVLGVDHGLTLNAMYNLGDMLMKQDKLDEAAPLCEGSLEGYRRNYGEDHVGAMHSLMLVGELRLRQERYKEAVMMFREATERRERTLGEEHPDTELARDSLEEALEAKGSEHEP